MSSVSPQQVLDRLAEVENSNGRLNSSQMDLSPNEVGTESVVAEFKAERPFAIRERVAYDLHLMVYEQFTTDGTGGNSETFSLAENLIDAEAIVDDLVVFNGGTDVTDSVTVDYGADEFDYTDAGSNNTLHVWYASDAQARVEVRKKAPKNVTDKLDELDAGLVNLREQNRDPLTVEFSDIWEQYVPRNWRVQIVVDAPYKVRWSKAGGDATPRNGVLSLPVNRTGQRVPGLGDMVKRSILGR